MRRCIISRTYASLLDGIFAYIANNLQSVRNAAAQVKRLEDVILSLDIMPERYRRYDRGPWKGRNLRVPRNVLHLSSQKYIMSQDVDVAHIQICTSPLGLPEWSISTTYQVFGAKYGSGYDRGNHMRFEWDEDKNRINKQKHGLSFETAAHVFDDPYYIEMYDFEHSDDEDRYIAIGKTC